MSTKHVQDTTHQLLGADSETSMPYTRFLKGSNKPFEGDAQLSSSLQYDVLVCIVMELTGADFG